MFYRRLIKKDQGGQVVLGKVTGLSSTSGTGKWNLYPPRNTKGTDFPIPSPLRYIVDSNPVFSVMSKKD